VGGVVGRPSPRVVSRGTSHGAPRKDYSEAQTLP